MGGTELLTKNRVDKRSWPCIFSGCTHTNTRAYTNVHTHARVCVCMYVCVYYVHIHVLDLACSASSWDLYYVAIFIGRERESKRLPIDQEGTRGFPFRQDVIFITKAISKCSFHHRDPLQYSQHAHMSVGVGTHANGRCSLLQCVAVE